MTQPDVLELYGTTITRLTPTAIIAAAAADLKRREFNMREETKIARDYKHYAFLRRHVVGAKTERDILERAVADVTPVTTEAEAENETSAPSQNRGSESGKKWTRILYRDAEMLRLALEIARNTAC